MITNVYTIIEKHLRSVDVVRILAENYVDGEYTKVTGATTKELAYFPFNEKELRFHAEGEYNFQDKKFYEIGSGTLLQKDEIHIGDDKYLIDKKAERYFDGGFTVYFGKRVSETEE